MNIYCIFFLAVLAVTEADLRSRNFSNIQPIEDFPLLQEKYPDVKYVGSLESSKIVGGNIAEPGQFPYQVDLSMLALWDDIAFYRKCGASVISSEYVLTAAQCVVDYILELFIRFGVHNVYQHEDEQVEVQVSNDNIIIHPQWYWDWYTQTFQNDIALIKLDEPINFTPRIQAVALPTRSQADESFEYYYGIVTGWGQGSMDYESDELRFAELPIISNEECREWLLDSVICADTIYFQSPCLGDEGGPFVINQNGIMVQIGITSFFGGDFFDGSPAGFTRVTSFLDFIEDNSNIVIDP